MFRKPMPPFEISSEHITNININGLKGRIAYFKAENKKNSGERFVIVSGMHTTHERMLGFANFLRNYGDVYLIDMPGFGGMDSFKKIGKDITFENFGDYLYTVLKTQKLTDNVTIFCVSVGGQFVTRMLQMHPDSQLWVKKVIGFVTFGAGKDFHMSRYYMWMVRIMSKISSTWLGAQLFKLIAINRFSLNIMIWLFGKFKKKMQSADKSIQKKHQAMEIYLWLINDRRTHARVADRMFTRDLRRESDELIKVPMHNILTHDDQYLSHKEVNKTFRDLYENYTPHYLSLDVHMPSTVEVDDVKDMFSDKMIKDILG